MIHSLNVAQTGLAASKASVENVMNNVANANTEGYKKRVVETSELAISDQRLWGRGVSIDQTVRITSQYMYDNIISENSKENYYSELSSMLENIESVFKETEDAGFSKDLDRYFQTIENLRANPNSEIYKNELKLNGQIIVDDLKRIYEDINAQEELSTQALNQNVNEINNLLEDIASVNEQINDSGIASNDLLDKRDLLEKQLSSYVDIDVNRDYEFYELKIGGEVAVRNDSVRTLTVGEEFTAQKDRYIKDEIGSDGIKSSILDGVTFDQEDQIVFELNNTTSVSVEYDETMTFDLDGDGTEETINVDETNYIRALAHKINSNPDFNTYIKAFNGNYSLDENDNKLTDDSSDEFLLIESKVDGYDGKFDSRITFVESEYSSISSDFSFSPVLNNNGLSISSSAADDGLTLSHTVEFDSAQASNETYDIVLNNNGSASGSNVSIVPSSVTYDSGANTITVPSGVSSFTITMDTDSSVDLNTEADYSFTMGTSGSQASLMTSTLTINNTGQDILQSYKLSVEEDGGSPFTIIDSINSSALEDGTSITHDVNLTSASSSAQVLSMNLSDDTGDYFTLTPSFTDGVTYDIDTNEITIPAGVSSFSITMDTNELADAGVDQAYNISITDNEGGASGTTPITLTSNITINDTAAGTATNLFKNEAQSNDATDTITLNLFDESINVTNGKVKAILENMTTESGGNKFDSYKESLDDFVKTFSDITSSFIKNDDGTYVYGEMASDENSEVADDIDLFTGSSVETFTFNSSVVGNLEQKDYDYLATIQWKDDISFSGFGQGSSVVLSDTNTRSFSEFYQDLRLGISRDKENSDFLVETQKAITESLNTSYDQLTKVDNDEEMINLIKYQAAYTANAKIITVVDSMLNTLLGIR